MVGLESGRRRYLVECHMVSVFQLRTQSFIIDYVFIFDRNIFVQRSLLTNLLSKGWFHWSFVYFVVT